VTQSLFIPEMAYQRMAYPAIAQLVSRIVAITGTGIAIYRFHASLAIALVGFPVAAVIWMALAIRSARGRGPLRVTVTRASMRQIAGIIWSFSLIEIFTQLFARVGVIVLSLEVGDAAAGLFATGLRLIETALVPLAFFGLAAYPHLSQLFATDTVGFRRPALKLVWVMLLAGLLLAWGLYFVAPPLLVPLLGERFAGTAPIIRPMAALGLVQAVDIGLGRILLSANLNVSRALYIVAGAVTSVALNLVLSPRFGVDGAIASGVAAYLVINVLSLKTLKRPLSGAALWSLIATLVASLLLVVGVDAILVWYDIGILSQAIACAGVLAMVAAAGYQFRFGAREAPDAPAQ
jgi:O-antigen/teichoic acid export membrane protein